VHRVPPFTYMYSRQMHILYICIYIINQSPQNVLKKFHELDYRQISISIITYGELFYGISKGHNFIVIIIHFLPLKLKLYYFAKNLNTFMIKNKLKYR
jgi:hypothetical protein